MLSKGFGSDIALGGREFGAMKRILGGPIGGPLLGLKFGPLGPNGGCGPKLGPLGPNGEFIEFGGIIELGGPLGPIICALGNGKNGGIGPFGPGPRIFGRHILGGIGPGPQGPPGPFGPIKFGGIPKLGGPPMNGGIGGILGPLGPIKGPPLGPELDPLPMLGPEDIFGPI